MASRPFLDTNVIVYLIAHDDHRWSRSEEILAGGGVISVQVLNEFVRVARRKYALGWHEVDELLDGFRAGLQVEPITVATHVRATAIARRHQIDIYDATIVAAAEQAGCDVLCTEDLQHGATIAGVEIRNPY